MDRFGILSRRPAWLSLLLGLALILGSLLPASTTPASAAAPQADGTITFDAVEGPDPSYTLNWTVRYYVQGDVELGFDISHFFLTSGTGNTGTGVPLEGQNFIGYCVNSFFAIPNQSDQFDLATDPNGLTYDPDGAGAAPDLWNLNRTAKWNALKWILHTYGPHLAALDQTSQKYADLAQGIGLAITEVLTDFDGTTASLDLNAGYGQIYADFGNTPITSGADYDIYTEIRAALVAGIASGVANSFPLYAATSTSESYQDIIFFPLLDSGDLPDSGTGTSTGNYNTLISDSGACHTVPFTVSSTTLRLGANLDGEPDGQPSATATGDDSRPTGTSLPGISGMPAVPDDEDGVTIPTLAVGVAANWTIVAQGGTDGNRRLYAWVDWNNDGDFGDANEQIASNVSLAAGTNTLSVTPPAGAVLGAALGARFRLTTAQTGVSWTGCVADGEVEDYLVPAIPNAVTLRDLRAQSLSLGAQAVNWLRDLLTR